MRVKKLNLRIVLPVLLVPMVILMNAHGALAAGGTALPWETPLTNLQTSLSGPVAKVISIIAIVVAGAALVFGEDLGQFARRLMLVILAIALIVGAVSFFGSIGFTAGASF
jgi:type IV secretory pathway VirB2 component (pilin)